MTLGELIRRLQVMRNMPGVIGTSTVIIEGYDVDDELVQADITEVRTECRCEDDDEPQAVYLMFDESKPNE